MSKENPAIKGPTNLIKSMTMKELISEFKRIKSGDHFHKDKILKVIYNEAKSRNDFVKEDFKI